MFNFQITSSCSKRVGFAAAFATVLCLGTLSACSDTAPVAKTEPAYYLNGKPSTKEEVEKLDPKTIARMDVLSGKQAVDYTHDAHSKGAVLVETN